MDGSSSTTRIRGRGRGSRSWPPGGAGRSRRAIVPPPGRSRRATVPPIARASEPADREPEPARARVVRRRDARRGRALHVGGNAGPRSRTSRRTRRRPRGSARRRARAAVGRGGARGVLEEVREDLDGERRVDEEVGRLGRDVTSTAAPARTSGRPRVAARKRSAAGERAPGAARTCRRRGAPSRGGCRSAARGARSPAATSTSRAGRRPRRSRRSRSRPSRIAVIGVLRSCETARRRDVLSASLSRRASRCVRSSRNLSRSTASATSRPTDASALRSARVPRTTRTPLGLPADGEREVDVARAAGGRHLGGLAAPPDALDERVAGSSRLRRSRRRSPRGVAPSRKRTSPPPRAPIVFRARPAASPSAPTRFVAAKRSTERS